MRFVLGVEQSTELRSRHRRPAACIQSVHRGAGTGPQRNAESLADRRMCIVGTSGSTAR
jgi:hypothetical protein